MYQVALSFAGEQRGYVAEVARALQARGIAVFYDEFEKIDLWGKDLAEQLQAVYEHDSGCVVMFVSQTWVDKAWPRHERRATLSRAVRDSEEYLLPVRFDDTPVPGLPDSIHYLRAEEYSPAQLASAITQKLGMKPFAGKASDVPPPRMTSLVGEVVFDYGSHNGRYIIGSGQLEFETHWTGASDVSIHVYNDPPSIRGVALAPREWTAIQQVVHAASLDFTSDSGMPRVGQIVVFQNANGFYAAVHVLAIKAHDRGDSDDELRFQYVIQDDGSDTFACYGTEDWIKEC